MTRPDPSGSGMHLQKNTSRLKQLLHLHQSEPPLLVLGPLSVIWSGVLYLAFTIQPLSGDLTRLGGYSEQDFGWNGVEEYFAPPLAHAGNLSGKYDIVIIGDSFSSRTTPDRQAPLGSFWTDFLAARSGLAIGVFDMNKHPLNQFLMSDSYLSTPPKVVIYETVERALELNLSQPQGTCPLPRDPTRIAINTYPLQKIARHFRRDVWPRLNEAQFDQAINYLKKTFSRLVLHKNDTPVVRLPLSRSDLFSNRRSHELLLINQDLTKSRWSSEEWSRFVCNLRQMRDAVEANKRTQFLVMVIPDKATIYSRYLPQHIQIINGSAILAANSDLPLARLDMVLKNAVDAEIKDVYLPNDTHWGTVASRIAAIAIVSYLSGGSSPPEMTLRPEVYPR